MEYKIRLERMEFRALHGCYDMEQVVGNRYRVEIEITTRLGEVASKDDVRLAVNYLNVYEIVAARMRITRHTIEAVALDIINSVKGAYPQIISLECTLTKLAPPLGGKIGGVSVVLKG
ncbi:MAG: dihydroneopterin aldolase [Rikenellaceae bacterium]